MLIGILLLWYMGCQEEGLPEVESTDYTFIFWNSVGDQTVERAVFDQYTYLSDTTLYTEVKGIFGPSSLIVNSNTQMLYWVDYGTGQIMRGPWDGAGNPEVLYTTLQSGDGPVDVALDEENGQLYWTQPYDHLLVTAPADGSGPVDTLFNAADGLYGPWGIAFDPVYRYLYWVEYLDTEVWRIQVDTLAEAELLYAGGSGFLRPYVLAVSGQSNALYIIDNPPPGAGQSDRILRGSTDGSMPLETLYDEADGVNNAYNITIDASSGALYWLNQLSSGAVYRGNTDGMDPVECIPDIYLGMGLSIAHSPAY